jgi:hypothetical protein
MSQNSLVSTITGYQMDDQGLTTRFFCHYVHTSYETKRIIYPMGTLDSLPQRKSSCIVKMSTHHYLVPKLKMHEATDSCPLCSFIAQCIGTGTLQLTLSEQQKDT